MTNRPRRFRPRPPNAVWAGYITFIPTGGGWLHLAVVLDVGSKRLVGYSMADHTRSELFVDAIHTAASARGRCTAGVISHSDRGPQAGFNRSSQHLDIGGVCGKACGVDEGVAGSVADEVAGRSAVAAGG